MHRLLVSLFAALLMTATLAMPAEAAGKPGLIQSVTTTLTSGTLPDCNYSIAVTFNGTKGAQYALEAFVYRTTILSTTMLWDSGSAQWSDKRSTKTFTANVGGFLASTTSTTYWYHVTVRMGVVRKGIVNVFSTVFTPDVQVTGGVCPALGSYTR